MNSRRLYRPSGQKETGSRDTTHPTPTMADPSKHVPCPWNEELDRREKKTEQSSPGEGTSLSLLASFVFLPFLFNLPSFFSQFLLSTAFNDHGTILGGSIVKHRIQIFS